MKQFMMGLALCLALAGCNHSSQDPTATGSTNPTSQSGNGSTAEAHPFGQSAVSQVDRSTPLSNYTKADDPSWLTYVFISRMDPQPSDDEKMKLFSAEYFNTQDTFKKHDLLASELPQVNATLAKYKSQSYYVLQTDSPYGFGTIFQPYDFASQSFHIQNCGTSPYFGNQGIKLLLHPSPSMCDVKVTDTGIARSIEDLRSKLGLRLNFTFYFFVDGIEKDQNLINATPTHVHIDISDNIYGKHIASFDID